MKDRIVELESLSAMQDKTIRELNTELYRQQQDLTRLRDRIELLEKKITEIDEPGEIAGNERPPHY